jgi:hypothetical protein
MTANQTKLLTCETYYYDVLTATIIYYLQGKITIKKHRYTMSIVTIIIDENSAQSAIEAAAAAQQALEINESGLVETVRQPYTHFQTNSKGFGNINLSVDEAGDIFLRME